jgi:hypothetical protein
VGSRLDGAEGWRIYGVPPDVGYSLHWSSIFTESQNMKILHRVIYQVMLRLRRSNCIFTLLHDILILLYCSLCLLGSVSGFLGLILGPFCDSLAPCGLPGVPFGIIGASWRALSGCLVHLWGAGCPKEGSADRFEALEARFLPDRGDFWEASAATDEI